MAVIVLVMDDGNIGAVTLLVPKQMMAAIPTIMMMMMMMMLVLVLLQLLLLLPCFCCEGLGWVFFGYGCRCYPLLLLQ